MFSLFNGPSIDTHITNALSTSAAQNKQLITSITSTIDKRIKIYHILCSKIKELSSSISTNLLIPNKHIQSISHTTNLQQIYPHFQIQKQNICRFNAEANNTLKKILKNIQDSLLLECNNIINITNKMEKKFKDQITYSLNKLLVQEKQLMNKQKNYQKQFEISRQQIGKLKTKYNSQWLKLQNLQIEYILSISQNNSEKQYYEKRKLSEIERLQKDVLSLEQNYLQEKEKHQYKLVNLQEQIQRFKVKNQQIQFKKVDILKGLSNSLSIYFVEYANNIIQRIQNQVSNFDLISIQIEERSLLEYLQTKSSEKQIQIDDIDEQYSNSFITNLRKKIVNKKIEQIICYGITKQHKSLIDNCINPQSQTCKLVQLNQKESNVLNVIKIFQRIFGNHEMHNGQNNQGQIQNKIKGNKEVNLISSFIQCMNDDQIARKNFILCLQKFRLIGKFEVQQSKIAIVQKILNLFLDICRQQSDIYNPKKLMVLSLTYYITNNNQDNHSSQNKKNAKEKIYLQHFIKDHIIWKNNRWWEGAFLQTVYEQFYLKQRILKTQNGDNIQELIKLQQQNMNITKADKKPEKIGYSQEKQVFYHNICLNQMAYFIKNMHIFQLPILMMKSFGEKYSKTLSSIDRILIQSMIKDVENQIIK